MLRGTPVSPGVAQGMAFVMSCVDGSAVPQRSIRPSEVDGERQRLDAAIVRAQAELLGLEVEVRDGIGENQANIFGAQRLILGDASWRARALRAVEEKRINVEAAVSSIFEEYARSLEIAADGYLRARAADFIDVGRRAVAALAAGAGGGCPEIPPGSIVVSDELMPSVTARLQLDEVRAFVTVRGNKFSHSSILARSLGTPAVAGVASALSQIKTGDRLIVDAVAGV